MSFLPPSMQNASFRSCWVGWLAMQLLLAGAAVLAAPVVETGVGTVPIVTTEFDAFVKMEMDRGHVPGMAISIIDGDANWSKVRVLSDSKRRAESNSECRDMDTPLSSIVL